MPRSKSPEAGTLWFYSDADACKECKKEGRKEGRQCLSSLPQAAPPGRSRSLRGWALV